MHHGTIIDSYNKCDKQCEVSEFEESLCAGMSEAKVLVCEIKIAGWGEGWDTFHKRFKIYW